jgi:hypothetical protein
MMAVLLLPNTVSAAGSGGYVSGSIDKDGAPAGASVTVSCEDVSGRTFTHHVMASSTTGSYNTQFSNGDCVQGAAVTVSANDGSESGMTSGVMGASLYLQNLNVSLTAAALPEFSSVTAVAALFAAVTGLSIVRRRQYESFK